MALIGYDGTYSSLFKGLNQDIIKASKKIAEAIDERAKSLVDEMVYNSYRPSEYQRTYQLRDSIQHTINKEKSGVSINVFHNTNLIHYNEELYQHGSRFSGDISDEIPWLVHEGKGGKLFGLNNPTRVPRRYMDALAKELNRGLLSRLFKKEMTALGWKVRLR